VKITKIEVCDFRGFKGPAVYGFEFGAARNLLIYGENGSGKSSLFWAIREFFNRDVNARKFTAFRNIDPPELTSGHVTFHFDDGATQAWEFGGARPLNSVPASQTALQVGCLDYRSLLETNFSQRGNTVNLFEIAVNHLVGNLEVPVSGGSERIGDLWETVLQLKPPSHHKGYLAACDRALDRFNAAFDPVISSLVGRASELLSRFPGCDYSLRLAFPRVEYDRIRRQYKNRELILSVHQNDELLTDHHNFLNEARLSAIGLVIYLAGLLTSVPPASAYPKVVVLDDVLVGLDMANRMPVMELLAEYFAEWQVILLTYDKIWYEMVRQTAAHAGWRAYELYVGANGAPVHRLQGAHSEVFFIDRAREHLANGDVPAAGNYARSAFEWKLKKHCDEKHVPVRYFRDPAKLTVEPLWQAAKARALSSVDPADKHALETIFGRIEMYRNIILNPLSHAAPAAVERVEVEAAIAAIESLRFSLAEMPAR
jgi:hypothetical protein